MSLKLERPDGIKGSSSQEYNLIPVTRPGQEAGLPPGLREIAGEAHVGFIRVSPHRGGIGSSLSFTQYNRAFEPDYVITGYHGEKLYGPSAEQMVRQQAENATPLVERVRVIAGNPFVRVATAAGAAALALMGAGVFNDHSSNEETVEASGMQLDDMLPPYIPIDSSSGSPEQLSANRTGEFNQLVIAANGADKATVKRVVDAEVRFLKKYGLDGHFNIYGTGTLPVEDPGCNEFGPDCTNDRAVYNVMEAARKAGKVFHIASVVQQGTYPNRWGGWTDVPVRGSTIIDCFSLYGRITVPPGVTNYTEGDSAAIFRELFRPFNGWHDDPRATDLMSYPHRYPYLNGERLQDLKKIIALGSSRCGNPADVGFRVINPGTGFSLQSIGGVYQLDKMSITAAINTPVDTQKAHTTILPYNNDGPGIDEIIENPPIIERWGKDRTVGAPVRGQKDQILLPDMTYKWTTKVPPIRPWPESRPIEVPEVSFYFHTPKFSPGTLSTPVDGIITPDKTPVVRWNDSNTAAFYNEVQFSGDNQFRMGSDATSFVFWNLVHGGQTTPLNSWKVPADFALAPGDYFWRVRHRVQGDGTEEGWSPTWKVTVVGDRQVVTPTRFFMNPLGLPILGENLIEKPILDLGFVDRQKRENERYAQARYEAGVAQATVPSPVRVSSVDEECRVQFRPQIEGKKPAIVSGDCYTLQ